MNELLVGIRTRINRATRSHRAQRNGLHSLGVGDDRIYVDHGLTGTNRDRSGLRLALAACRAGDTLVVTKLDRLARSLPVPGHFGRADQAERSSATASGGPNPSGTRGEAASAPSGPERPPQYGEYKSSPYWTASGWERYRDDQSAALRIARHSHCPNAKRGCVPPDP
jgi:hypothetical protein